MPKRYLGFSSIIQLFIYFFKIPVSKEKLYVFVCLLNPLSLLKISLEFLSDSGILRQKGNWASMDDRFGLMRQGSGLWLSLRDGDFEEDEVWDVLREKKEPNSRTGKSTESSISIARNQSSAARVIPRANSSNNSTHEARMMQQSAPVNIPDWSIVSQRRPKKPSSNSWLQHDVDNDQNSDEEEKDEEEESDYSYKLPPHELIAKRLARSQISSFSVFEGVGRKLKGRDLSKVRNAVLVKTGFLESP